MQKEDYDWRRMSDKRLAERLQEELRLAKRPGDKRDRAIAHKNAEAIIQEQTRRFEKKWLEEHHE